MLIDIRLTLQTKHTHSQINLILSLFGPQNSLIACQWHGITYGWFPSQMLPHMASLITKIPKNTMPCVKKIKTVCAL